MQVIEGERVPAKPLEEIFALKILWRSKRLVAAVACWFVVLAGIYLFLRPVTYMSSAQLIIENRVLQTSSQDMLFPTSSLDMPLVKNQMAILSSDVILRQVADNLALGSNDEFIENLVSFRSVLTDIAQWIATSDGIQSAIRSLAAIINLKPENTVTYANASSSGNWRSRAALWALKSNLTITGVGSSYAIEIRHTATDPQLAAEIVNEIARVYLLDQAQSNAKASRAASAWLRERLSGLGTTGRVITEASPATGPQGPAAYLIISAALVIGLGFGAAAAWGRDFFDKTVRSANELVLVTGSEHFGYLPWYRKAWWRRRWQMITPAPNVERPLLCCHSSMSWAVEHPLAVFTHTLRRIGVALDTAPAAGSVRITGVTATSPGEGSTVVAGNLARVLAASGKRVLLIDAVPYDGRLSELLATNNKIGLLQVLGGAAKWSDAVVVDGRTGLHVLPLGSRIRPNTTLEIWGQEMANLLKEVEARYDHVIFDLPPLVPVPDVRAAAPQLDAFVLVVEWAKVSPEALVTALGWAGVARDKLIGTVFNKVRMADVSQCKLPGKRHWGSRYIQGNR